MRCASSSAVLTNMLASAAANASFTLARFDASSLFMPATFFTTEIASSFFV